MENVTKILTVIISILVAVNALDNTNFIPFSDGKTGVQLNMVEFCKGVLDGYDTANTDVTESTTDSTDTSEKGIQWEFDTDWLKIIINPEELCTEWNRRRDIPDEISTTSESTDSTLSSTEVSPTSSTLSETATSTEVSNNENTTNVTSTTPVPTVTLHNDLSNTREPNDNTTSIKPTPTETAATTSSPISTSTSKPYDSNNVDTLKGNNGKDNGGMSPGLMYFLIIAASFICGVLVAWGVITLRRRYKANDYNVGSREAEMGTRRP